MGPAPVAGSDRWGRGLEALVVERVELAQVIGQLLGRADVRGLQRPVIPVGAQEPQPCDSDRMGGQDVLELADARGRPKLRLPTRDAACPAALGTEVTRVDEATRRCSQVRSGPCQRR